MLHVTKHIEQLVETTALTKKMEKLSNIDKEQAVILKQLQTELHEKNKEVERLKSLLKQDIPLTSLKLAFNQIQDFLALSPISIYFKDKNLKYTYANQAFAAFVNLPIEDLLGLDNKQLQMGDYLTELEQIEREVLKDGQTKIEKEIIFSQDEEQLHLKGYIFPTKNLEGEIEGLMVYCLDLSERIQFKNEIEKAQEKALAGLKSKESFLANLSHEIRTPLHGILGSGALLKSILKDKKALEFVEDINSSGISLLEMVDSMLLCEAFDKGELTLQKDTFNLRELIQEVKDKFHDQVRGKMLDIQSFVAQGLPEVFVGDKHKIKQVLSVFIGNALKFTEKGFIHLFVQAEQQNEGYIRLKFSIKDTGTGIKKELQSELFTSFTQGDSSSTKAYQGTGLGLAMAEKTVSFLGGTLGFESAEFKGSTFWFAVDLENISSAFDKAPIRKPSQLPVLLVEDNKINQKIAFFTLKKLGFPVEIAENGLEAVERFQNGQFNIVLMDLQMPVMNGFDATVKIRAYEKSKNLKSSLIVAISANTIKEDVRKCFVVGMNEYISKPFSPEKLIEIIQKHIEVEL